MLCDLNNDEDQGNLSVTAWDLPVSSDGSDLASAFDAMVSKSFLSGRAVTIISPSASGKAMVSLAQMKSANTSNDLTRISKAWIPVAPGSVLSADESAIRQYKLAGIPILAIHGDQDKMGAKVTHKLQVEVDAKGVELEGKHPVYLDSPEEFVQEVMQFLVEEGL